MAIAQFKKIEILAHNISKDDLIADLHEAGLVQIQEPVLEAEEEVKKSQAKPADISELKSDLDEIEHAIKFLEKFETKKGFAGGLIAQKPLFDKQNLKETYQATDFKTLCMQLKSKEHELEELRNLRDYYVAQCQLLAPWTAMTIPLEASKKTRLCNIAVGTIPLKDYDDLFDKVSGFKVYHDVVYEDKVHKYIWFIYLKDDQDEIGPILKNHNFNYTDLPEKTGTIKQILDHSCSEISRVNESIESLIADIKLMIPEKVKLFAGADSIYIQMQRQSVQGTFKNTKSTFFLSGWILAECAQNMAAGLNKKYRHIDVFISDPQPDEEVPVLLENPKAVKPYEVITQMYGMPHHAQVDPTPYLAPFFFVFFGLCLTDAGYGLLIMLAGIFLLKKMKLGEAGKKFMRLVVSLGTATLLIGALMGGWFGNATQFLPKSLGFIRDFTVKWTVLDPLSKPDDALKFILICLILGIVHVILGMIIKFVNNALKRNNVQAYLVDLPWILLILSLLPLICAFIFNMRIPNVMLGLSKLTAGVSGLSILFFTGGAKGNIFVRMIQGGYALYNITGYLADVMSYFRLFALGLATGGIALAINSIVKIVAGIPFVGPILAGVIFLGGHLYNLLINLLSAFVHTCRLQFLEFFQKFFEGGGKEFTPFKVKTKYVTLKTQMSAD